MISNHEDIKIYAHTSFIGDTGYANHSRSFFTALNKLIPVKIRNFAVGKTWEQLSNTPHDKEYYITDEHKEMLIEQTLFEGPEENKIRKNYFIYGGSDKDKQGTIINIILMELNHYYYYDNYNGPKVAYNVWESTLYPDNFFNKLLQFDQLWVPSEWQRSCVIKQGMNPDKVKVVPEGVDGTIFFPEKIREEDILNEYRDDRFKFLLFGRWDYRKSTTEIIKTFLETFSRRESADLIISVDNPFSMDGMMTTEERLSYYGFNDSRIKVKHFPPRSEYIEYLKTGHVFVSCARSEGWGLPLCESMACGTPSIYSNWGAQLEFAKGRGIPVDIKGECLTDCSYFLNNTPGNYCEPDFKHLSIVMRDVYENYWKYKERSLEESNVIRKKFTWEHAAKTAYDNLENINVIQK